MTSTREPARPPGRPGGLSGAELLEAAREIFVRDGYSATTMDAVATAARISKQTLYRRHPSKEALFAAVVADWVDRGRDAMRPHLERLLQNNDPRVGLRELASVLQAGVLSPAVVQMRTLVIAESERLPEVADAYVRRSWERNERLLSAALAQLADRGSLRISDPDIAAQQFTWLVLGAPLDRLTLTAGSSRYTAGRLSSIADEAVETFLARHGVS
ncbi:TetR/AcrR family transcriptional regulator [Microbacterium sp. ZW T5_56]|uniref:TetR/AcrR family transcriptional regulator n=1 Tax=Microbacterium sp. ZW T5_56 TaxID=3378081 RepID=UPI003854C125